MRATLRTGGEVLGIQCDDPHVAELVRDGSDGQLTAHEASPSVVVHIERSREPFPTAGWPVMERGAHQRNGAVVIRDVCTSGFDLHARVREGRPEFVFRWRPPHTTRLAAVALPERARLLARAVLLQYPALWWASARGRVPVHASVVDTGWAVVLLAGASGVGKSTLVAAEVAAGGSATSDNLCVTDGRWAWGVVEPVRLEGAVGRRTTHGRREGRLARRVERLEPSVIAVLRRGESTDPLVVPCEPADAGRALAAGTYAAGELRRFWPYAATLAAATGVGPVHPPVAAVCRLLARQAADVEIVLGHARGTRIPLAAAGELEQRTTEGAVTR